jgi:F-type H+-transporting ATPase subunit delta
MISRDLRVARRYARALFSLAGENLILERAYEDMKQVSKVYSLQKELRILMKSPMVREGKKQKILQRLFESVVHPLIMHYMLIITRKRRASLLEGIALEFQKVYKEYLGIEQVQVITAKPLDEEMRKKVLEVAAKLTPLKIEFSEKIDPSIIGGFILNLGNSQYDASVRGKLHLMRRQLNI